MTLVELTSEFMDILISRQSTHRPAPVEIIHYAHTDPPLPTIFSRQNNNITTGPGYVYFKHKNAKHFEMQRF